MNRRLSLSVTLLMGTFFVLSVSPPLFAANGPGGHSGGGGHGGAMPEAMEAAEVLPAIPLATPLGIPWATFLGITPAGAARIPKKIQPAAFMIQRIPCPSLLLAFGHGAGCSNGIRFSRPGTAILCDSPGEICCSPATSTAPAVLSFSIPFFTARHGTHISGRIP